MQGHRAPCQDTTAIGCFSQVCQQAQEGSSGWKPCLQAAEACPGHCHFSAWTHRNPSSPAVGDSKMQITQLRHPGSVRWRVLKTHNRGKGQLAWGSTDTQGLQLSHFQTN